MQNGRRTWPNVANTMQDAKWPCQNVANTRKITGSSSKLLQIQGKWYRERTPKKDPKSEAKKKPKTILHRSELWYKFWPIVYTLCFLHAFTLIESGLAWRADQDLPLQDVRSMELLKLIWSEKDGDRRIRDNQRKGVRDTERDRGLERELGARRSKWSRESRGTRWG